MYIKLKLRKLYVYFFVYFHVFVGCPTFRIQCRIHAQGLGARILHWIRNVKQPTKTSEKLHNISQNHESFNQFIISRLCDVLVKFKLHKIT